MQNTTGSAPDGAVPTTPKTIPLADVLKLLDDTGLNFVLHTHHPATHLEYAPGAVSTDPWANQRFECPEAPEGVPTGWGERG
jgi:hypothetical protein